MNECYQICHDDRWEEQISEEMNYHQDFFSVPVRLDRRVIFAYNMGEMLLANEERRRLSVRQKTKKFTLDYEILDKKDLQQEACTLKAFVWEDLELQDFSDGISDTCSLNSVDHSWEMVDLSCDDVNLSTI